jgi:hypothetical protein
MLASYVKSRSATFLLTISLVLSAVAYAQSGGSTSITGTVVDPSGAVVANATVEVRNPVSGFSRNTVTDAAGKFVVPNVPFNPYHMTVTGQGFAPWWDLPSAATTCARLRTCTWTRLRGSSWMTPTPPTSNRSQCEKRNIEHMLEFPLICANVET